MYKTEIERMKSDLKSAVKARDDANQQIKMLKSAIGTLEKLEKLAPKAAPGSDTRKKQDAAAAKMDHSAAVHEGAGQAA